MTRPNRTALQKQLVGPAGEHFVLSRLYQHGILASLAPPRSAIVDVLVLDPDQRVVATVQVKTRTYGRDQGWHMSKKHETIKTDGLFYAFVDLEPEVPATYIVPSSVVADVLQKAHRAWIETPGKGGRPHNPDSPFRRLRPDFPPGYGEKGRWLDLYQERWDLLAVPDK